jgi:hypothetical protein
MRKFTPLIALLWLAACAPVSDGVRVRIALPDLTSSAAPTSAASLASLSGFNALTYPPNALSDFQCYMVNVYGPGIGSDSGSNGPQPVGDCPYRGVTSDLVATNSTTLSLTVPAGPARTIQVIGFAAQNTTACPGGTYRDYESSHPFTGTINTTPAYTVTQLGKVTTDLYKDKSVTIKNTYVSGNSNSKRSALFQK